VDARGPARPDANQIYARTSTYRASWIEDRTITCRVGIAVAVCVRKYRYRLTALYQVIPSPLPAVHHSLEQSVVGFQFRNVPNPGQGELVGIIESGVAAVLPHIPPILRTTWVD